MNFWDQRYSESGFAYGLEPNDFLKQHSSKFITNGKILCLCEGEGRNAIYLASQGFEVTAVDSSSIGMSKAHAWSQSLNLILNTVVCDLNDFVIEKNSWDGIISIFGHLPPDLRKSTHKKIIHGLKPNGFYLSESYTKEQLKYNSGGPKDEAMLMSLEIIQQELNDLEPIVTNKIERTIHEGKYHQGLSAVVQYLGKKTNL
jgi:2-polyprenyl-3-methyl-5-hydroxy-6-metoxy-1,4-benzoquinol methylase